MSPTLSQEIINLFCNMRDELQKIRLLTETREKRDVDIVFITIPEDPTPSNAYRDFQIGITKIDFRTGIIQNPDGTLEHLNTKLNTYYPAGNGWLHSLSIEGTQNFTIRLEGKPKRTIVANFITNIPYLTYYSMEIETAVFASIAIFACSNPSAVIGQFKVTVVNIVDQETVSGDSTEAQSWDTVLHLKNNLNRIRNKLNEIIGGTLWNDTVSASLSTLWGKFHATTGHKHTGAANDAPLVDADTVDGSHASAFETSSGAQSKVNAHAAADVSASVHPNAIIMTAGTFTGNGTANRAIAHGLGRLPKFVVVYQTDGKIYMNHYNSVWATGVDYDGGHASQTNTAWTTTNFYVGDTVLAGPYDNRNGYSYGWIAWG